MQAGRLRDRITIQRKSVARDSFNGEQVTWVPLSETPTVWASVTPISGREFVEQDAVAAQVTFKVKIRWRDDLLPSMRVVCGALKLNIEAVLPDNVRRECVLMCSTIVEPTATT